MNKSVTKYDNLAIIGASGHGKVVYDIAKSIHCYDRIVFLDDNPTKKINNWLGTCDLAERLVNDFDFIIAIGNYNIRREITEKLEEMGAFIATLVHNDAVIGSDVVIENGTVVMAGAVINSSSKIGKSCIINTASSVDHDCKLGDYVHVAVGAHLCGTVAVGDNTWVGAGATVINNIEICEDCFLGAGAVVVKNITTSGKYIGVPARICI